MQQKKEDREEIIRCSNPDCKKLFPRKQIGDICPFCGQESSFAVPLMDKLAKVEEPKKQKINIDNLIRSLKNNKDIKYQNFYDLQATIEEHVKDLVGQLNKPENEEESLFQTQEVLKQILFDNIKLMASLNDFVIELDKVLNDEEDRSFLINHIAILQKSLFSIMWWLDIKPQELIESALNMVAAEYKHSSELIQKTQTDIVKETKKKK